MRHERAFLEQVVESLADGNDIDWSALEGRVDSADDRRVLEQLKILARIAEVHRSHAGEPEEDQSLSLLRSRGFGGKVIPMPVPAPADGPPGAAAAAGNGAAVMARPFMVAPSPLPLTATQVAPAPPPVQTRWGHLELHERIGEGTFGEVYRARDTQLDREVAVKLLRVGDLSTDRQTRRVLREGRSLARVEHDNVVAVYGAEAHEGRVGLWMELIRGATLEQLLRAHGPFSAREAALIGQDLCSAVAAVHNTGLVHRDIKAQNVMREEGGRLVLMDFGAGQPAGDNASALGRITGTPLYLAPEVLAGGESTTKSDIYSIGVLLYHLVTNDYPVRANSLQELREAHAQGRRTHLHDARPELPAGLIQVIERAIEPDAQRRYQTAGEMQAALDRFLASPDDRDSDDLSWIPMPKPLVARLRRMGRTRALALAVAAGVACLALGAGIAWQTFRHTATLGVTGPAERDRGDRSGARQRRRGLRGGGRHRRHSRSALDQRRAARRVAQIRAGRQPAAALVTGARQRLGADTLIEGRLERVAENYQLSLRLIRAGSDQSVAIGTFTAPISQRLGLSQPAAEAVARALRTPLPAIAAAAPARHGRAGQRRAGEIRSRALLPQYRRQLGSPQSVRAALRRGDPHRARLRRGSLRPRAHLLRDGRSSARGHEGPPRRGARARGARAASRQLALPEAHAVMGIVAFYDWRWEEAEREFTKAVMLSPSNEFAVERYAMFLAARGRVQEGITHLMKVRRLDPLSPFVAYSLASLLTYDERYDEALAEVQRARSLDPTDTAMHVVRGRVLSAAGRYDDAIDSFRNGLGSVAGVRYALAEIARRKPARDGATRRSGLRINSKTTRRAIAKNTSIRSCSDICMRNWAITIGRSRGWSARSTNGALACFG